MSKTHLASQKKELALPAFPINRFLAVYSLANDYTFSGKKCVLVGKSPSRPMGWAFDSLMESQVPLARKEEIRKRAKDHLLQGLK